MLKTWEKIGAAALATGLAALLVIVTWRCSHQPQPVASNATTPITVTTVPDEDIHWVEKTSSDGSIVKTPD